MSTYKALACRFAPELYYEDSSDSYKNVTPEDMGGLYWQAVGSSEPWADVCIQYIVYFRQQRWSSDVLERFSFLKRFLGKLPGNHPNDYAPIFLYFKAQKPVKAVFDICHYEAVGAVTPSSDFLPQDKRPKFHIRNFYRGLLPLKDKKEYSLFKGDPIFLSREHLTNWWNGLTSSGSYDNRAKLIIKEKLENPFQEITTFRNSEGALGSLFDLVFRKMLGEKGITISGTPFTPEDFEQAERFIEEDILREPRVQDYLVVRKR